MPGRDAGRTRTGRAGQLRMPLASTNKRLQIVLIAMAVLMSLCAGRLLQLQGFDSQAYAATAARQMTRTLPLPAVRGTITDRNGTTLAEAQPAVAVTCDPTLTGPKAEQIADMMIRHIGGDRESHIRALTKPNTRYSVVQRKVPAAAYQRLATELSDAYIYGIFRESDPIRTYPEQTTAASLVGFVGADSQGQGGVEYSMNKELAGTSGREMFESSPAGYRIPLGQNVVTPASNGTSYQLTIDSELQVIAERRLADMVDQSEAKSGSVVVLNVKTGEVLAMANAPTFDSNRAGQARPDDLYNRAITQAYEPGSVHKVLTFSALVEDGVINPETRVVVPPTLKSGGGLIKDVWRHGYAQVTARGILTFSSNIGTILMTRTEDKNKYLAHMRDFGLGKPTGIELPGEASGSLPEDNMPDAVRDQVAYGQGLSVTAIQNAAAIAGIANHGMYNKPTILRSATDAQGRQVAVPRTEPRRIVSENTSKQVVSMMESVVSKDGFAKNMAMPDYRLAGKTGTSENFDTQLGKYSGYTSSFVGVAPAEDPQILVYAVVNEPTQGHTGGAIAGPVFYDTMRTALPRYGILPSATKGPEGGLEW